MNKSNTENLYNQQSQNWSRTLPSSLSDFTGRPPVFKMIESLTLSSMDVLDLGCGEGYPARTIKKMGCKSVTGLDLSQEMINRALEQEEREPLGIAFKHGDIRSLRIDKESFDLVVAIFVFNYMNITDMSKVISKIHKILKPGGSFIFSVPHPCFSSIWKNKQKPFYFDFDGGYFSSRDKMFSGEIYTIAGVPLKVQKYHKTFQDYFNTIKQAGFNSIPLVNELGVTEEHLKLNYDFFSPLKDIPLHVAFKVDK